MLKGEKTKSYTAMTTQDVAELLAVTDRQVRKWITQKGLPAKDDPRGKTLDWPVVLAWYVAYRNAENSGTRGTQAGSESEEEPLETMEAALARKTRAEADLKELQLARERGQVAAVTDVQKVLTASNKSIQTLMLSLPAALATRLIGLDDRAKIYTILEAAVRSTLSNLANIDAIREAKTATPEDGEE